MALTPASVLADYSSGIGTQGATLKVNTSDKRVGIGTTNPQGTLQVGTGVTVYGNTGIVSATNVKANTANFSGNVTVGGVLTYEDVTNVDSVGIITARSGIEVGSGVTITTTNVNLVDSGKIQLGNGNDLQIYHDSSNSVIKDNGAGKLILDTDGAAIEFQKAGLETIATFNADGAIELRHDNVKKFETTSTGAVVTGILTATTLEQTQTYPTIRPTLDLNFAATKTLDRRITFTRDGVGTFTDELGIVKYASNNVPRFDHDPTTGESLGLLIEESRTNNNKVTNLAVDGMTAANGWEPSYMQTPRHYTTVTSPDGLNNSTLLAPNTQNLPHYAYVNWPGDVLTGIRTVSCWFKNLSTTIYYPQLRIIGAGSGVAYANFTLSGNGTISSGGSDITGATITPYPNGWYRCTLSWNTTTTHYGGGIVISNSMSSELPAYVGDVDDTKGFLAWGFQDEAGSFATSLIPTNGSTVTRGRDIATITGTNFTNFYNQTEGTAFVNALMPNPKGVAGIPAYAFKSSANSSYYYGFSRDNTGSYHYVKTSNADSFVYESLLDEYRAVLGIETNNLNSYINDANQNVNLSTITLFDADILHLGSTTASNVLNGHIKRFTYYPKRLTDNQLQGFTA